MTRIVAGVAGGRRIDVPAGRDTRPTSDRAREALFSTLGSLLGELAGLRVLDLYAGSGAVGLEALSRGAAHACLVEASPRAVRTIRANVDRLGLTGAELRGEPVARVLTSRPDAPYDILFADPPYAEPAPVVAGVTQSALVGGWLRPGAVAVVERASRDPEWRWPEGFEAVRHRRYGEGTLWYGRAAPAS